MKAINWNNVEPAKEVSFDRPTPGGYVCRIVLAEDFEDKEYVKCLLDIAEGKHAGRGVAMENSMNVTWGYYPIWRSYKESAQGFFRAFLNDLEKCNPHFTVAGFRNTAEELRGLYIGIILRDEEYLDKNNEKKVRTVVSRTLPVDDVRSGNYKVPGLKPLSKDDEKKVVSGDTGYVPFSDPETANIDVPF